MVAKYKRQGTWRLIPTITRDLQTTERLGDKHDETLVQIQKTRRGNVGRLLYKKIEQRGKTKSSLSYPKSLLLNVCGGLWVWSASSDQVKYWRLDGTSSNGEVRCWWKVESPQHDGAPAQPREMDIHLEMTQFEDMSGTQERHNVQETRTTQNSSTCARLTWM